MAPRNAPEADVSSSPSDAYHSANLQRMLEAMRLRRLAGQAEDGVPVDRAEIIRQARADAAPLRNG